MMRLQTISPHPRSLDIPTMTMATQLLISLIYKAGNAVSMPPHLHCGDEYTRTMSLAWFRDLTTLRFRKGHGNFLEVV